jgi:hypothetical protein
MRKSGDVFSGSMPIIVPAGNVQENCFPNLNLAGLLAAFNASGVRCYPFDTTIGKKTANAIMAWPLFIDASGSDGTVAHPLRLGLKEPENRR